MRGCFFILNINQKKVVEAKDKYIFLLAGAGTGKTRVIIERIKRLIQKGVSPKEILVISFTKRTVNELKFKLRNYSLYIATFHGLCYQLLKSSNNINIVKERDLIDSGYSKDDLLEIDLKKRSLITNHKVNKYNKFLKNNNLNDYTDLEIKLLDKLQNNIEFSRNIQKKFKYIFIDEFQDTSQVQFLLLKNMINKSTFVFCVGDPNQAIYSFRGASSKVIKNYIKIFKATTYYLDLNYRSTYFIIKAANKLLDKYDKVNLRLFAYRKERGSLEVKYFISNDNLIYFIDKCVRAHLNTFKQKNIAIIYRSHYIANSIKKHFFKTYYENLNILTVHQAKGLEFDVVFFIGLEEGNLPLLNNDINEEKNIFYVGLTRAKTHLYLCSVLNYKKPSRFIKECLI